jgi:SAM-dependent methyltransferase
MVSLPNIYYRTNESLLAITTALEIKEDDKILSICSSGAQPLALLENLGDDGKLLAIDQNPDQLQYARQVVDLFMEKQRKAIKELNLAPKDWENKDYFLRDGRLAKITKNLDRLDFKKMNVLQPPRLKTKFTKGYFSNAPVYLPAFGKIFSPGASIYVVYATNSLPNKPEEFMQNRRDVWEWGFEENFRLDIEKTAAACKIEEQTNKMGWTPAVFRRV